MSHRIPLMNPLVPDTNTPTSPGNFVDLTSAGTCHEVMPALDLKYRTPMWGRPIKSKVISLLGHPPATTTKGKGSDKPCATPVNNLGSTGTGMDAKRLRPKADQAVSSVSAMPALVNNYNSLLKRRLRQWAILALVYFSGLMFWQSFDNVARQRSRASEACRMRISTHCKNSTGTIYMATKPGILDLVTRSGPDDAHLTWHLERDMIAETTPR